MVMVMMMMMTLTLSIIIPHLSIGASSAYTVAPGFNRAKLASGTVVPDWVYAYGEGPSVNVTLSFRDDVKLGELLPRNSTQARPRVALQVSKHVSGAAALLTLVLVDPDARSPDNPVARNVLHWIVCNIPSKAFAPSPPPHYAGKEIWELGVENVPYFGPAPPLGIHRYYALIFQQETHLNISAIESRRTFSVRNFTKTYHLYYPIGGTFFEASANDQS